MSGYSGTPLVRKLGIEAGTRLYVDGGPAEYRHLVEPLPDGVEFLDGISIDCDFVHLFTSSRDELARVLASYREGLKPTAIVWVSWPKKASKVPTDVTEDTVRELALPLGFVDVKVCAVTDVWSGLKLVVRKELR